MRSKPSVDFENLVLALDGFERGIEVERPSVVDTSEQARISTKEDALSPEADAAVDIRGR